MPNPYEDDYSVSDSGGAPQASPLLKQPGISLAQTTEAEDRKAFVDSRSTIGSIALPFQEMRAARQGRLSEFEKMQVEKQKGRKRQLEEIKVFTDVVDHTFEKAAGMQGEERNKYIGLQGKVLDALSPGSSEFLKSLAADPEYEAILRKNADKSPTLRTALEVGGLRKAMTLFNSVEGSRLIRSEIEGAEFPAIRTRLQTLGMAAQELMSPDRYKQMMDDGFISPVEAAELNDAAKGHPKYKAAALSDEQLSLASRNEDATYGMAGFATSKTAQDVLKKRGEETGKERKVRRGTKEITQEFRGGKWTDVEQGEAFKPSENVVSDEVRNKVAAIQLKVLGGADPSPDERKFLDEVARTNPLVAAMRDALSNAPVPSPTPSREAAGKIKPPAKPKKGETISRGGKKYKVVGFAKDGEPLVELAR